MKLTKEQEDVILSVIEDSGKANELIIELQAVEEGSQESSSSVVLETELRTRLLYEEDWRKKAQISAMIISKNLD